MSAVDASAKLNEKPTPAEDSCRALVRAFGLLERVMEPYFAKHGISGSQWGLLRTLHRAEQAGEKAVRVVDLSERMLVRAPSVTGAIDRLERMGLVTRTGSTEDLRTKNIALSRKGRQLVKRVLLNHAAQYERVMGVLSRGEQGQLHESLRRLCEHLQTLGTS